MTDKKEIANADDQLLAELGYKQEFKRAFTPLEVIRPFPTDLPVTDCVVSIGLWNCIQYHWLASVDCVSTPI